MNRSTFGLAQSGTELTGPGDEICGAGCPSNYPYRMNPLYCGEAVARPAGSPRRANLEVLDEPRPEISAQQSRCKPLIGHKRGKAGGPA